MKSHIYNYYSGKQALCKGENFNTQRERQNEGQTLPSLWGQCEKNIFSV